MVLKNLNSWHYKLLWVVFYQNCGFDVLSKTFVLKKSFKTLTFLTDFFFLNEGKKVQLLGHKWDRGPEDNFRWGHLSDWRTSIINCGNIVIFLTVLFRQKIEIASRNSHFYLSSVLDFPTQSMPHFFMMQPLNASFFDFTFTANVIFAFRFANWSSILIGCHYFLRAHAENNRLLLIIWMSCSFCVCERTD